MMKLLVHKLWNDDDGALIAIEFLFIATILIIGIVVGLVAVRTAVNAELTGLASAILGLNEGFTISGVSGCCASSEGSQVIDIPTGGFPSPICTPPSFPVVIEVLSPCS